MCINEKKIERKKRKREGEREIQIVEIENKEIEEYSEIETFERPEVEI